MFIKIEFVLEVGANMAPVSSKFAIVSFDQPISARNVRLLIKKKWGSFTDCMDDQTILFIAGLHGDQYGKLGGEADSFKDMKRQVNIIRKSY